MSARAWIALVSSAHELGGAEVYLLSLIEQLGARAELELLASDRAPAELYRRAAAAGAATTPVHGLARLPTPAATARLARLLRRRRPQLVHVNLSDQGDGLAAIAAARLARVPVCATLHIVLPQRRRPLELLSRLALARTRSVIGVSEAVGAYLTALGAPATVVRNGVGTPSALPDARARLGAGDGGFVVGGVGRLDRQKGWDLLCDAAPRVRERVPEARFVVVGDGPERDLLRDRGAAAAVDFLGYRERAADLIGGFDVLAVPSRYEGFGLVAVEAMLAGVPVVAAAVGGLPEVVGDAGLLIAPEDPAALADALTEIASDERLRARLTRAGAERARARFGAERMAQETFAAWQRAAPALERLTARAA